MSTDNPTPPQACQRTRSVWLILVVVTMAMGLASRRYGDLLPTFVAENIGDALWALMVFFGCGFLFPKLSTARVAALALTFSYAIEFSQLIQTPWLKELRSTPARLVLGQGFLWEDLVRYAIGIGFGVILEWAFARRSTIRL